MLTQKNIIIAAAILLIIAGIMLAFGNSAGNFPAPTPQEKPFRQSGEVSFPNLAKFSGCPLPADSASAEGKYDAFAKCLTEKGVKMYGAYWCGHCQNQKKAFGDSFKYVNYIECADPNSQKQLDVCAKEGIEGYPTWEFPAEKANSK